MMMIMIMKLKNIYCGHSNAVKFEYSNCIVLHDDTILPKDIVNDYTIVLSSCIE